MVTGTGMEIKKDSFCFFLNKIKIERQTNNQKEFPFELLYIVLWHHSCLWSRIHGLLIKITE